MIKYISHKSCLSSVIVIVFLTSCAMRLPDVISYNNIVQERQYIDANGTKWLIAEYDRYRILDPFYWVYFPDYFRDLIKHKVYQGEGGLNIYTTGLYKYCNGHWELWVVLGRLEQNTLGRSMDAAISDDNDYLYILFKKRSGSVNSIKIIKISKSEKKIAGRVELPCIKKERKAYIVHGKIMITEKGQLVVISVERPYDMDYPLIHYILIGSDLKIINARYCMAEEKELIGIPTMINCIVKNNLINLTINISRPGKPSSKVSGKWEWVDQVSEKQIKIEDIENNRCSSINKVP